MFASSTEARICGAGDEIGRRPEVGRVRLLDGGAYLRRKVPALPGRGRLGCSPPRRRRVFAATRPSGGPKRSCGVRLLDGGAYLRLRAPRRAHRPRRTCSPPRRRRVFAAKELDTALQKLMGCSPPRRRRVFAAPAGRPTDARGSPVFASSTEARICGGDGRVLMRLLRWVFASSTEARICGESRAAKVDAGMKSVRLLDGGAYLRLHEESDRGGGPGGVRLLDGGAYLRLDVLRGRRPVPGGCSPPRRRRVFAAPSSAARSSPCRSGVRLLDGGAYLRR